MLGQNLYELTNPQKSIWELEQFYKNTSINNIVGTLIIKEKLNNKILEKSINKFIELNDSFNIRLHITEEGTISQFFTNFTFNNIDYIFINSHDELIKKEKELAEYSFPLLNSPLYKFVIFNLPNGTRTVLL